MVDGFSIGDALRFEVHVNAKAQPQASTGSVARVGISAGGSGAALAGRRVGMDATSYAPGRVLSLQLEDSAPAGVPSLQPAGTGPSALQALKGLVEEAKKERLMASIEANLTSSGQGGHSRFSGAELSVPDDGDDW
ncbi:unnamed protein product [Prorocentrum cordatum]|uniref:Arpin n=1 Tax=Prorocentrum cordatum TaxID=2364126 RepID=A0ABN9R158_9DINO|nr:unnamed protein product [Polarella glacialis]